MLILFYQQLPTLKNRELMFQLKVEFNKLEKLIKYKHYFLKYSKFLIYFLGRVYYRVSKRRLDDFKSII
jgi:hypothetical protein